MRSPPPRRRPGRTPRQPREISCRSALSADWVATGPAIFALTNEVFGRKDTPVIISPVFAAHRLGGALAAFGAGVVRSAAGDYSLAFVTLGAAIAWQSPPRQVLRGNTDSGRAGRIGGLRNAVVRGKDCAGDRGAAGDRACDGARIRRRGGRCRGQLARRRTGRAARRRRSSGGGAPRAPGPGGCRAARCRSGDGRDGREGVGAG